MCVTWLGPGTQGSLPASGGALHRCTPDALYLWAGLVRSADLRFLRWVGREVNMPWMTIADLVKKNVEYLPMREQARIFSESFRASVRAQEERAAAAKETFGSLTEAEGRAMEEALRSGRPRTV